ncbi:hypothetical protein V8B97DRAFT_1949258 [Scleroderma yunnanense]
MSDHPSRYKLNAYTRRRRRRRRRRQPRRRRRRRPTPPQTTTTETTTARKMASSLSLAPTTTCSSTETMAVSSPLPVYGVTPPDIASLKRVPPTTSTSQASPYMHLHPSPSSSSICAPIPLLPLTEFSRMHLEHATAHPPDSVLFPFLHGLEGNNDAQCSFFASTPATVASAAAGLVQDSSGRVIRPPRYRGLVWVLCDEDVQGELPQICTAPTRWEDDLTYDSDSSDYSTDQGELDNEFEFDYSPPQQPHDPQHFHPVVTPLASSDTSVMDVDPPSPPPNPNEEEHMHPIALRITTSDHPHHLSHDRRHSDASSSDSASTYASSSSSLTNSGSGSTSATSLPSPTCTSSPPCAAFPNIAQEDHSLLEAHSCSATTDSHSEAHDFKDPPILTSTFLPSQLIQPCQSTAENTTHFLLPTDNCVETTNWEFKPAIVPEGISLRNFGVQVPLYTSISDIVVYSPRGPSPAALRLAARFRCAVEKKRAERLQSWVRTRGEGGHVNTEDAYVTPEGFLKYGVYILDADAAAIKRQVPWMIMQRECDRTCASEIINGSFPQLAECYAPSGYPGRSTLCSCDYSWHHEHGSSAPTMPPDSQLRDPEIEPELIAAEPAAQVSEGREESSSPPRATYTRSRSHTHPYHPRDGQRAQRERQDIVQLSNGTSAPPPCPITLQDSVPAPINHFPHCSHSRSSSSHLIHTDPRAHRLHRCKRANTIDFAQREKEEMRDLTRASEIITVWGEGDELDHDATCWDPHAGQVFLGNTNDVPVWTPPSRKKRKAINKLRDTNASQNYQRHHEPLMDGSIERPSPFESDGNSPSLGRGFDICIECHEYAPLPSMAHLRAVEDHVRALEMHWIEHCQRMANKGGGMDLNNDEIPTRPPPHPSAIIHLPFPSSQNTIPSMLSSLIPVIRFLEGLITPGWLGGGCETNGTQTGAPRTPSKGPRLPSPWSSRSSHSSGPQNGGAGQTNGHAQANGNGHAHGIPIPTFPPPKYRPRPLKLLLYSSDGYTESSVPALCLLMAMKGLSLPEAYLEMQVVKRRSFFVYQAEVALLKKVEARLGMGSGQGRARSHSYRYRDRGLVATSGQWMSIPPEDPHSNSNLCLRPLMLNISPGGSSGMRCPAMPIAHSATMPNMLGVGAEEEVKPPPQSLLRRPRASTLPTFIPDHQSWFDDARFDGSFPSRVLPFLYLGNLNHASNAYMLHALGITHVVSVGECALVPPLQPSNTAGNLTPVPPLQWSSDAEFAAGQGLGGSGSLWIEEREGRIKVLDIKGVCDDGIDTLEHQLHPICTWIEKARQSGGQVLVHCRVGVSRSATVTIAYVMQYLGLSLVEAYLIVRSRRLSVLIQPNMRLLYNLLGWEVRLARERAGGDEIRLREELRKALSWSYLAREVHALNEKYLG